MNTSLTIGREEVLRLLNHLEYTAHVRETQLEYRRTISSQLRNQLPGLERQLDESTGRLTAWLTDVIQRHDAELLGQLVDVVTANREGGAS